MRAIYQFFQKSVCAEVLELLELSIKLLDDELDDDDRASSVVELDELLVWAVELEELNELCELDDELDDDEFTLVELDDELRLNELPVLEELENVEPEDVLAWVLEDEVDRDDSETLDMLDDDDVLELLDTRSVSRDRKHRMYPRNRPAVNTAPRISSFICRAAVVRIAKAARPFGRMSCSPIEPIAAIG